LNNLSKEGDIIEDAIVTELGTRSLDVVVPRFGIEKRIWIEDLVEEGSARGCHLDSKSMALKIHWNRPETTASGTDLAKSLQELSINQEDIIDGDTLEQSDSWVDITESEDNLAQKASGKDKKAGLPKVQTVRMFDAIRVKVVPLMDRSPPQIKLLALYPEKEISRSVFAVVQDALVIREDTPSVAAQAMASCPAMADDRD
jgi:hypothetical protein